MKKTPLNIILIISDTFRYDNLFHRASMPVSTPNLDEFSRRSVSMSRMYTSSFPTVPHRTDLTSGRYSWPWHDWQSRTLSSDNHLPHILSASGYVSQLICDCPHLFTHDFHHCFTGAMRLRGQEGDMHFLRMNHEIETVMPPEKVRTDKLLKGHNMADLARWVNRMWYKETDRFPPRTAEYVVEWLEENYKQRPFFLWVDFFDPHEPWDPPEYMVRKHDPLYEGIPMIHPSYGKASVYSRAELRNLRAHYCAEAELVDRWIGRVLQKIDDLRLWDNSVVVFTTDHGMSLGEHNRTGKSNIHFADERHWPLYSEIAHIPFMVSAPGLPQGVERGQIMQPPDILPTLLNLAGARVVSIEPMHGASMARVMTGNSKHGHNEFAVCAAYLRCTEGKLPERASTPVVYDARWAYAPFGPSGKEELFDLSKDEYCLKNLAAQHPRIARNMRGKLLTWLRNIKAPKEAIEPFET